ncbi:hypothetical protein HUU62_21125 [Rhodoferax sp. 4810]|nr:hypothetical protein [Rhodoferax jenense]
MSIFRAPSPAQLPHFSYLMQDTHATPEQLAHYLDISPATFKRYIKSGGAPRAVHLALYWESRWGLSQSDVELYNLAQVHRQHARGLSDHLAVMAGIIETLEMEFYQEQPARRGNVLYLRPRAANLPRWRVA